MRSLSSAAAVCSVAIAVVVLSAAPAAGQPAAPAPRAGATAPQAGGGRAAGPPPSPATLKRARKVLLDAIVKEVATRRLGDCTVKDSLGAKIVSVVTFMSGCRKRFRIEWEM